MRKIISLSYFCLLCYTMLDTLETSKIKKEAFFGLSHYFSRTKKMHILHHIQHLKDTQTSHFLSPAIVAVLSNRRFLTCVLSLSTFIFAFLSLLYIPSGYFCQVKLSKVIAKVTPLYTLAATQLRFTVIFKKKRHFSLLWLLTGIITGLLLLVVLRNLVDLSKKKHV